MGSSGSGSLQRAPTQGCTQVADVTARNAGVLTGRTKSTVDVRSIDRASNTETQP